MILYYLTKKTIIHGIEGLFLFAEKLEGFPHLIGKISSKAIWVKESDNINVEDISFKISDTVRDPNYVPKVGSITRTYWDIRVKVLEERGDRWLCEYLDEDKTYPKGETYKYGEGVLGYTNIPLLKVKCSMCETFH